MPQWCAFEANLLVNVLGQFVSRAGQLFIKIAIA
jgi:hypothetical protein